MSDCDWYCENCSEGLCSHCDIPVDVNGKEYCENCVDEEKEKKDILVENHNHHTNYSLNNHTLFTQKKDLESEDSKQEKQE